MTARKQSKSTSPTDPTDPTDPTILSDGTVLTAAEVDRIVAEVDEAVSRGQGTTTFPRRGRPSLSGGGLASPHVGFRISAELRDEVEALAQRTGVSVSALARRALEEYVKKAG